MSNKSNSINDETLQQRVNSGVYKDALGYNVQGKTTPATRQTTETPRRRVNCSSQTVYKAASLHGNTETELNAPGNFEYCYNHPKSIPIYKDSLSQASSRSVAFFVNVASLCVSIGMLSWGQHFIQTAREKHINYLEKFTNTTTQSLLTSAFSSFKSLFSKSQTGAKKNKNLGNVVDSQSHTSTSEPRTPRHGRLG